MKRGIIGLTLLVLPLMTVAAVAQDAAGVWLRENGQSRVRVAPCGAALCGHVIWLANNDGPSKVGQRVFFDMKPDGPGKWSGSAFNPEDGKTYAGGMSVNGKTLVTRGCVLGGVICRSVSWSRVE